MFQIEESIVHAGAGFKLRYVIVEGEIETPINRKVAYGMMGPGLTAARERLDEAKKPGMGRFQFFLQQHRKGIALRDTFIALQQIVDGWRVEKDFAMVAQFLEHEDYKVVAERIHKELEKILGKTILLGRLDVTFFRDDFRRRDNPIIPNKTQIDFIIEGKKVLLIDDVLYTGRTIRSGLDAMLAYGRPDLVELLVLVDRRFSRHLPIKANYIGIQVDSLDSERVEAKWEETEGKNEVILKWNKA